MPRALGTRTTKVNRASAGTVNHQGGVVRRRRDRAATAPLAGTRSFRSIVTETHLAESFHGTGRTAAAAFATIPPNTRGAMLLGNVAHCFADLTSGWQRPSRGAPALSPWKLRA